MKYRVHVYPVCRLTFGDIEANTPKEAAAKALAENNLYDVCPYGVEYAEDITCFVVDELDENGEFTGEDHDFDGQEIP
jgi:hypothetical protein